MKIKIALYLFAIGIATSCSETVEPRPFTYSQIFSGKSSKTWKLKSIAFIEKDKPDQTFSLSNCLADDRYVFYANGERLYQVEDGTNKCSFSDPDILVSDTWSFVNATASLTIILPFLADFPLPYIVKEVDNSKMVLEIYLDEAGTQSYQMTFNALTEK